MARGRGLGSEKSYGWKLLAKLPRGTKLYTIQKHRAASGMMAVLQVLVIQDGQLIDVRVPEAHGWSISLADKYGGGYRVGGAGFDKSQHVVEGLSQLVHQSTSYFKYERM
jgi:hypothetical protein